MLESLMTPFTAKKRPWEMFFIGLFYYCVACVLSIWVFREYASIVVLLLTIIAIVPLIYRTIILEERTAIEPGPYLSVLIGHLKYFSSVMYLFGGIVLACALWYVFAPASMVQDLFAAQIKTIAGISITGHATNSLSLFIKIFYNNIKVLIFCIIFSCIYGSGAIFILTWNASVIGAAIGYYIRTKLAVISSYTGWDYMVSYFGTFSIGLLKYVIHGIPEILAYFIGGLAGGIISVGIMKKEFISSRKFPNLLWDASNLIIIAIVITFIAAILEVYVTPMVFR
ncbi:MAG: stage II sporulation protein M [Nanoarchaeota archaeon]|nr:stage II sporulation protein M [Nanoarchaeota archaeon]